MDERSDVFALGCDPVRDPDRQAAVRRRVKSELIDMAAMSKLDDAHASARAMRCRSADIVELTNAVPDRRRLRPARKSAEAVAARASTTTSPRRRRGSTQRRWPRRSKRTQKSGERRPGVISGLEASPVGSGRSRADTACAGSLVQSGAMPKAQRGGEAQAAESNLANFNRLSHAVRLETAKAMERALYPAWPDKAQAMRAWLDDEAKHLRDAMPELKSTLELLEARALPWTEAERAGPRARHPRAAELANLQGKFAWR